MATSLRHDGGMTAIRHIVFDIGRVLIHYDPELAFLDLIPDAERRRRFLAEVCSPEWNLEQDRGRRWEEAEAELIARHPEDADLIRAFRARWPLMVPHAHEGTVAILESLVAQGRDVTFLTNFHDETFQHARRRYPFLDLGRGATVSAEIGLLKPDPAIYAHHAESFRLAPAATLFIDDSPANVEGARAAGWQAVRFLSPERLRTDLAAYGIAD